MNFLTSRLARSLTITAALLLATVPVEGAVEPPAPAHEPEKAMSCTAAGTSSESAPVDHDALVPDGPRMAASKSAQGPDLGNSNPSVCPLHLQQAPGRPSPAQP